MSPVKRTAPRVDCASHTMQPSAQGPTFTPFFPQHTKQRGDSRNLFFLPACGKHQDKCILGGHSSDGLRFRANEPN